MNTLTVKNKMMIAAVKSNIPKGMKLGVAQEQWKCCRELRLINAKYVGEIMEGCNMNTEEKEMWIVIRIDKKPFHSILQKIIPQKESKTKKPL